MQSPRRHDALLPPCLQGRAGLHELAASLESIARRRNPTLAPCYAGEGTDGGEPETLLQRYTPDGAACIASSNDRLRAA